MNTSGSPLQKTKENEKDSKDYVNCMKQRDSALYTCPRVFFMIEAIKSLGCKIDDPERFISCIKFDGTKAGGFQTQGGEEPHIFLAQNAGFNQSQV